MAIQLPPEIGEAYRLASKRLFIFDYDGTLVKFNDLPHEAKPATKALDILKLLGDDPKNRVVIISGRDRFSLENWLGHLPIGLVAEHGALKKTDAGWQTPQSDQSQWKKAVRPILNEALSNMPGSTIEEKETAMVLHYRLSSDQKNAESGASRLAEKLLTIIGQHGLEIRRDEWEMVVEIKQAGTDKGRVVREWLESAKYDFIFCAGDSTSDEKMFEVLPAGAFSLKVGGEATAARYRINNPDDLIDSLTNLLQVA